MEGETSQSPARNMLRKLDLLWDLLELASATLPSRSQSQKPNSEISA